jgi:hypothetical protein
MSGIPEQDDFSEREKHIEQAIKETGGYRTYDSVDIHISSRDVGRELGHVSFGTEVPPAGILLQNNMGAPVWYEYSNTEREALHRLQVYANDQVEANAIVRVKNIESNLSTDHANYAREMSCGWSYPPEPIYSNTPIPAKYAQQPARRYKAMSGGGMGWGWGITILFIVVVFAWLFSSCSPQTATHTVKQGATAASLNTPQAVMVEKTATASPAPTYSGQLETVVAELAAKSDADRATAISARETAAAAEAIPVQATSDAEQRELGYKQMTAQADAATWTAYPTSIPLTVAAQSTKDTQFNIQATMNSSSATGTAYAPTQVVVIAISNSQAKNMDTIMLMEAFKPLILLIVCVLVVSPLIYVLRRPHITTTFPDTSPIAIPIPKIKLETLDAYGWGSLRFADLPVEWDVLLDVARLMVDGRRYTEAQMTGASNPLVKDGSYDIFGDWMMNNHIAWKLEDGRYRIAHPEFFEQVLTHKSA